MTEPLLVEFVAGPGVGKSTTAAAVFTELKIAGYNAELVPEYAKALTWEGRTATLGYQPYVMAKQMWTYDRLRGQVDVILSDTSTLLCLHYGTPASGVTPAFKEWVLDDHLRRNVLTVLLVRDPSAGYAQNGRHQTLEEAKEIDRKLRTTLELNCVPHFRVLVQKDGSHVRDVVHAAKDRLRWPPF